MGSTSQVNLLILCLKPEIPRIWDDLLQLDFCLLKLSFVSLYSHMNSSFHPPNTGSLLRELRLNTHPNLLVTIPSLFTLTSKGVVKKHTHRIFVKDFSLECRPVWLISTYIRLETECIFNLGSFGTYPNSFI